MTSSPCGEHFIGCETVIRKKEKGERLVLPLFFNQFLEEKVSKVLRERWVCVASGKATTD